MLLIVFNGTAQDEGEVIVKKRFERSKTAYFSFGPSFTLGKNLGDYSTGINIEAGFLKRSNKLISWGPSLSYLYFAYDESKTYPYYYDAKNDFALELTQTGGDISLVSLGLNIKLNFVPVSDNSIFSFYGIVNPFVSYVSRQEVTEDVNNFSYNYITGSYDYYVGTTTFESTTYPALASDNKVSGGAHLGLGAELWPAKRFSFFGQATFSYTLPVSYIATSSFLKDEDKYYDSNNQAYYDAGESLFLDDFPIIKKGFSALSIKAGMAFNF